MRFLYLICCALMAQGGLVAQALGASNAPQVGDRWEAISLQRLYSRSEITLPTRGATNATFDFRYLGGQSVLPDGTTYNNAPKSSFKVINILDRPTIGEHSTGLTPPDYPSSAVISTIDPFAPVFAPRPVEGGFQGRVLTVDASGVRSIGTVSNDGLVYTNAVIDPSISIVELPFGLTVGESFIREVMRDTSLDGRPARQVKIRDFEVLATGTLRMPFGDYEDAVAVRVSPYDEFNVNNAEFLAIREGNAIHYYVPGSFEPILTITGTELAFLNFGVEELISPNAIITINRPDFNLTSVADLDRAALQMSVYPNPVAEALRIDFQSQMAGPVELKLVSLDGRQIMSRQYRFTAGPASIRLRLPADIAKGTYLAQIIQGGKTSTLPVFVQR